MAAAVEYPSRPVSSRAASVRSDSLTPIGTPAPSSASVHSASKFSKFRAYLNNSNVAIFDGHVTIHELSNVPQLDGQFSVRWKFRAPRLRDAERYLDNPVPRRNPLDNKPTTTTTPAAGRAIRHSHSAMSLRTVFAASTSTTGTHSGNYHQRVTTGSTVRPHAATLPLSGRTVSTDSFKSLPDQSRRQETMTPDRHRAAHKQGSDPTPLRQQVGRTASSGGGSGRLIVEEPEEWTGEAELSSDDAIASSVPTFTTGSTGSSRAQSIHSITPSVTPSINSAKSAPKPYPSSLGVGENSTPSLAPSGEVARRRVTSQSSHRSSDMSLALDPNIVPPPLGTQPIPPIVEADSHERKGQTPMRSIRSHSVSWEYKLQHVLRVPLGKPVAVASSSKKSHSRHPSPTPPADKKYLPVLGGGSQSDSSIKLEVYQGPKDGEKDSEPKLFGYVNIDLAPFADHPPAMRKFLLKDSKANATIRISVDMRYIGGEQEWTAPPMQEGHSVGSVVTSLTGEVPDIQDLQLLPTPSISSISSNSSLSGNQNGHTVRSVRSGINMNNGHQPAAQAAAQQTTQYRYKSFEHHLLPEHNKSHRRTHSSSSQTKGRNGTMMTDDASLSPAQGYVDRRVARDHVPMTASPVPLPSQLSPHQISTDAGTLGYFSMPLAGAAGYSDFGSRLSPVTSGVDAPTLGLMSPDWQTVRQHHSHYLLDEHDRDLQPDLVIESVFNPAAGEEFSPFTYIPIEGEEDEYSGSEEQDDGSGGLGLDTEPSVNCAGHGRWGRLRARVKTHSMHPPKCDPQQGGYDSRPHFSTVVQDAVAASRH